MVLLKDATRSVDSEKNKSNIFAEGRSEQEDDDDN